jgi:hypothetical protein
VRFIRERRKAFSEGTERFGRILPLDLFSFNIGIGHIVQAERKGLSSLLSVPER